MKSKNKQPAPPASEVDYLARYREGDPKAFRQLVDVYRDRMLQFFYRLWWHRDRSEDLLRELFIKLMESKEKENP